MSGSLSPGRFTVFYAPRLANSCVDLTCCDLVLPLNSSWTPTLNSCITFLTRLFVSFCCFSLFVSLHQTQPGQVILPASFKKDRSATTLATTLPVYSSFLLIFSSLHPFLVCLRKMCPVFFFRASDNSFAPHKAPAHSDLEQSPAPPTPRTNFVEDNFFHGPGLGEWFIDDSSAVLLSCTLICCCCWPD